jgi:ribonuclease VapC
LICVAGSALIAVLLNEPQRTDFTEAIMAADGPQIGAPNYFEACLVAEARQGVAGWRDLDRLSSALGLTVVAFNATHIEDARDAYRRFGKGRHRAGLNFGDCCAYALAKSLNYPLLFKGNDFVLTDIKRAL